MPKPLPRWTLLSLALLMLLVGIHARFDGLGRWPLATDEFYMMESVGFWASEGVPRFPEGGYYNRGLLVQAVVLATVSLLGESELTARLPLAVTGVLAVGALFLLARRRIGMAAAVLIAGTVLLSSWHVEFSRFVRMYAPLLLVTLMFSYAVLRGWLDDRSGWRVIAVLLATLSLVVHQAQIILACLLLFLLLTPAYRRRTGRPWLWLSLAGLSVAVGLAWRQIPSTLPADETVGIALSHGLVVFPVWGAHQVLMESWATAGLYVMFVAGGLFAALRARMPAAGVMVAVVLAGLQVGLALVLLFVLVCWGVLPRGMADARLRRGLGPLALGAILFVVLAAVLAGDRSMITTTIDYPRLYQTVISPWVRVLPALAGLCFLAAGLAVARILWHGVRARRDLIAVLACAGLLAIATTQPVSTSTRYSYMFYPLLMLLLAEMSIRGLRLLWLRFPWARVAWRREFAVGLVFVAFLLSQDFQPRHLARPASAQANFRTGRFAKYSAHWYQRVDYRGLAEAAQGLLGDEGMLFLDRRTRPVARYFPRAQARMFMARDDSMVHLARPVEGGQWRDLWTNLPLSFGFEKLAEDLGGATTVLFAMHVDDREWPRLQGPDSPVGRAWQFQQVYVDLSGDVGLYRVLPQDGAQQDRSQSGEGTP